jgi:hypothetical protein
MIQGDYFNQTQLHPAGLVAVCVLGLAMLFVPRRFALIPMLILACFISSAQRIVVAGLDFDLLRVMVIFGWTRILLFGETKGFRWKHIDTVVAVWALSGMTIAFLRELTFGSFVQGLGLTFDVIGMYFLFRLLIREWADLEILLIACAVITVPVTVTFLVEQQTGRNMFSIFGGVAPVTEVRDGRVRCRGPFSHPIYAGCFWASLLPLFWAMFRHDAAWRWLMLGALLCTGVLIFTTASSTPVLAVLAALFATGMYRFRGFVPLLRWATVGGLVTLHFLMRKPVWHLLARVDVLAGSTGWYRYRLVDGFIRNADVWWLLGSRDYEQIWGPTYYAVTNQYILEGVEGGLLTFVLFIAIVVLAFRGLGACLRAATSPARHLMAWCLGSALFVHSTAFFAVSYFGQIQMLWYLTIAAVGSLAPVTVARRVRRRAPRRRRTAPGTTSPGNPAGAPA